MFTRRTLKSKPTPIIFGLRYNKASTSPPWLPMHCSRTSYLPASSFSKKTHIRLSVVAALVCNWQIEKRFGSRRIFFPIVHVVDLIWWDGIGSFQLILWRWESPAIPADHPRLNPAKVNQIGLNPVRIAPIGAA